MSFTFSTKITTRFVVNGKTYGSLAEMPAEDRATLERAMKNAPADLVSASRTTPIIGIDVNHDASAPVEPSAGGPGRVLVVLALLGVLGFAAWQVLGAARNHAAPPPARPAAAPAAR
jgi:hypothetical protein